MDPNPYSMMPGLNSSKFKFSNPFYNYQNPSQDLSRYQKLIEIPTDKQIKRSKGSDKVK